MYKLYRKSEIWFAVAWIVLYVVGTSVADATSSALGVSKIVTLVFHVILCAAALVWLKKYNLYEKYGLCKPKVKASKFLFYIPLVIAVSLNFWFGVSVSLRFYEVYISIASMICVGFLEELIFRGILFKAMCKDNIKSAIVVSSLTFGIGHIINLTNGSGADVISTICQICYAIAFGFMFVIIFHRGGSLLPCIIAHSSINALGVFSNVAVQTMQIRIIVSVILTVVAITYTLILLKALPKKEE